MSEGKQWMKELRRAQGLSRQQMAMKAGCSQVLLAYLEIYTGRQGTTHPLLAKAIGKAYGMTAAQAQEITNQAIAARLCGDTVSGQKAYGR